MKIIQINSVYNSGSTGKIVKDLNEIYHEYNLDSQILFGRGTIKNEDENDKSIIKFGSFFWIHAFCCRILGFTHVGSYFQTRRLLKILKREMPDVVHLHNLHGYYVNFYTLLNYLFNNKIPTVLTMHDEFFITGKCCYSLNCEKWKASCNKCEQLKKYPKTIFFDRSNFEFNKKKELFAKSKRLIITPVSNWLRNEAENSQIMDKLKMQVVYNGLDTQIFRDSTEFNTSRNDLTSILYINNDLSNKIKGARYFFKLCRLLENSSIKIYFVGDSKEEFTLPDRVINLGKNKKSHELAKCYRMVDFTLLTSEKETFSMITAESICCGTPVIGFKSGAPEEIAPFPYGIFFEYKDINSICNYLLNYTKKESSKNRIMCEEYGKRHFDKYKMADSYLRVYENLLKGDFDEKK
ncbi:MAG: glycosyltransferase [Erysipelotrichales bacterium]|nr:glycosyltransferase [Erysipelotrichales bacterium]